MLSQNPNLSASGELNIEHLRAAIQANQLTFPVPVPVFVWQHKAEVQWRLAELYFVHGWSTERLGARYRVSGSRVRQSLRSWVHRARTLGYMQPVPPEADIRGALVFDNPAAFAAAQPPSPPALLANLFTPASGIEQKHV
jgi:hypothetical protein